jgi:hypothetical protein
MQFFRLLSAAFASAVVAQSPIVRYLSSLEAGDEWVSNLL